MLSRKPESVFLLGLLVWLGCHSPTASAWVPSSKQFQRQGLVPSMTKSPESMPRIQKSSSNEGGSKFEQEHQDLIPRQSEGKNSALLVGAALTSGFVLTNMPENAFAAVAGAPNAIGAAFAAYGHFISLMAIVACVVVERVTIKPNMSDQDEDLVAIADTLLGVFGFALLYSGYLRVTEYEKGWEFYSHSPVFWVKMTFTSIFGAASFFNTTKIIQRAIAKRNGNLVRMTEPLAARMIQICNAELTALLIIPLTASLMARGVGYTQEFPWEAGAAVTGITLAGLGFRYIKEAVQFDEGNPPPVATEDES